MRKLLLILLFPIYLFGTEWTVEKVILVKKIDELASPFNLADSIKAIAIIESDLGTYPINLQDPSCGVTHINLKTFLRRHNIVDNAFNRNKACSQLLASDELAISNAIEELLYWQTIHCKKHTCNSEQWMEVLASYNCGFSNKKQQCLTYAKKVKRLIQTKAFVPKIHIKGN